MRFTKTELQDDLSFIADITETPLADPFYDNIKNNVTSFKKYGDQSLKDIYYELSVWFDIWRVRVENDKQGDRLYTLETNRTWRTLRKLYFYFQGNVGGFDDYTEYRFYRSKNYVPNIPNEYDLWHKGK
tara:strand:- start:23 stop:409 length:387 start_codon:yes stop_codon:yes gene_type:complete